MQVNQTTGTNFTGVIPVRVLKDGQEILDRNLVRKTCLEVIDGIAGPLKDKPSFKPVAAQLAVMDNDYKYIRTFHGHNRTFADKKLTASDFFKIIFDNIGRGYIVTGKSSDKLSELGKAIGIAKRDCKICNVSTSPNLETAKANYWEAVKRIGNNLDLRIRETFAPNTLEKFGKYQQMDVQISTKPRKIKGKEDTKVILDNISFSDRIRG